MTVLLESFAAGDLGAAAGAGLAFVVGREELRLLRSSSPSVRVDLSSAARWNAALPWEALQARREPIRNSAMVVSRAVTEAQKDTAGLRWKSPLTQAAAEVLGARRRSDPIALRAAIEGLCGLGEGLTPQGDDWLAGWLLGLRLAEPMDASGLAPGTTAAMVTEAAYSRTTLLSRAFLACAAAGEAMESWHVLLSQMARDPADERDLESATRTILEHGATSGAAMLEGFLAGLGSPSAPRPPILGENTQSVAME